MTTFKPTAYAADKRRAPALSHEFSNWFLFICPSVDKRANYNFCQSHIAFVRKNKTGYTYGPCVEQIKAGTCPALAMMRAEQEADRALFLSPEPEFKGVGSTHYPVFDPATGEEVPCDKPAVRNFPIRGADLSAYMRHHGYVTPAGGVLPAGDGKGLYHEVVNGPAKIAEGRGVVQTREPEPEASEDDFGDTGSMMADAITKVAARERKAKTAKRVEAPQKPAERPKRARATQTAQKSQTPPSAPQNARQGMSLLERARQMRAQQ